MMRLFCKELLRYYNYHHRYEFTLAPLNYYERHKIKIKLRHNINLNKLDNCRVIQMGNLSVTKYITKLDLSYNKLTSPPVVNNLTSLTCLDLSDNQLTSPPIVNNLTSLKYLDLSDNQLTSPPIVNNLKSLIYLYLYNNQLTNEHVSYIRKLLPNCNVA